MSSKYYELRTQFIEPSGRKQSWSTEFTSREFDSASDFLDAARAWYDINGHYHHAEIFQIKKIADWSKLEGK
ncbi:hypothetical protein [Actinomadura oligospora]|uniref:hypothetical protein n=1 Tax=Actinomadura oligospora TaxID=111804 RepID=UPI000479CDA3|nr:hypothetical protein [Actinomadura oligospora]